MRFSEKSISNLQFGGMVGWLSIIIGVIFAWFGFTVSFGGDAYTYTYKAISLGAAALLLVIGLFGVFFFNALSAMKDDSDAGLSNELPPLDNNFQTQTVKTEELPQL